MAKMVFGVRHGVSSRVISAVVAVVLGTSAGCSSGRAETKSTPTHPLQSPATPLRGTKLSGFRAGEISLVSDPRGLLSPDVRRDAKFGSADFQCDHMPIDNAIDRWVCTVFADRSFGDGALTKISLRLHGAVTGKTATTFAVEDFDKWRRDRSAHWVDVKLGDRAVRSLQKNSQLVDAIVVFRVANVLVEVSASASRPDGDGSALLKELENRSWRVASDLAKNLSQLRV
ncbi:hypothetical protein [Actinomadura rayongensis]|uniref:DUF3558 domain-containing protein n=1 Tax=Actinomadura rayongensis TaxID=1429076 RepID=A0A6I4W198_9ACTN|nr:hypothetical protein [Actinomadura rayongensis]MXQ64319.1 hypothetical protein [Actinomadura rayongensis]